MGALGREAPTGLDPQTRPRNHEASRQMGKEERGAGKSGARPVAGTSPWERVGGSLLLAVEWRDPHRHRRTVAPIRRIRSVS